MPLLEAAIVLPALAVALALRPWRMLAGGDLAAPLLACLVLLPWVWALPALHAMPLQLSLSGACLALLMLGWPLAVPVLLLAAGIAGVVGSMDAAQTLSLAAWRGVVPATLALGLGALMRRWLPAHLFIYVLGRAFIGTVLVLFASLLLAGWAGERMRGVDAELSTVALWLMAWGEGVVTGMLVAVFVAFRPQWLATWSDTR